MKQGANCRIRIFVAHLFMLFLLGACATTKNLPQGEQLYVGIKQISVVDAEKSKNSQQALAEVEKALSYAPNNALFGSNKIRTPLPIGLWLYNSFVHDTTKLGKWIFDKFAGKPIYISTVNPKLRTSVARSILAEYGFFQAEVDYDVLTKKNNPRKAMIAYKLRPGRAYIYDSIQYVHATYGFDTIVHRNLENRLLYRTDPFNVYRLEEERKRISSILRDSGYYYFKPRYINYEADTLITPGQINLRVLMEENLPLQVSSRWKIGAITVNMFGYDGEQPDDSLVYQGVKMRYYKKLPVRKRILRSRIKVLQDRYYQESLNVLTRQKLSLLETFSYVEMLYQPRDTTVKVNNYLDLTINTKLDFPIDIELEANVVSKSNNQIGPGAALSFTKRNLFGGGEQLNVRLKGSYEWETRNPVSVRKMSLNSYEYGINTSISFPQVLFPWVNRKEFPYPATTRFQISGNVLNRAKFFKLNTLNGSATYDFRPSEGMKHSIVPARLTYTMLERTTQRFDSIIIENPALQLSLENQLIPSMGYTFTYDDAFLHDRYDHFWVEGSITSAGNIFSAAFAATGRKFSEKRKKFLGNPFAQFIKATGELRYTWTIDRNQSLATRFFAGAIYSYGNVEIAPYSEMFFSGGANSIRAYTVRTIGPGRFQLNLSDRYSFLDQVGDIKLEGNMEYRFKMLGNLEGALFLDAGNIWLIREDPIRPGGTFNLKKLGHDIALGTGLGIRYDLEYLVVRMDLGVGLHLPYDTGKRGYYNIPKFKDGLALHLSVGYPF